VIRKYQYACKKKNPDVKISRPVKDPVVWETVELAGCPDAAQTAADLSS